MVSGASPCNLPGPLLPPPPLLLARTVTRHFDTPLARCDSLSSIWISSVVYSDPFLVMSRTFLQRSGKCILVLMSYFGFFGQGTPWVVD